MSKWTKVMLFAVVLGVVSMGSVSLAALGSDDFNRADATDLGADWLYCSNQCNPFAPQFLEHNDPTAGIVSNEAYGINPPDNPNDMLYGAASDDGVDNATSLFRTAYMPYEIDGTEPLIVVECDIRNGSWDGLTLHQSIGFSTNPTFPPPIHDGYYWYTFNTVFRNTPGDSYGGMRIQKMSSVTEVGGYSEAGIATLEALDLGLPVHLKATSDNAGHLTFSVMSLDQLTTYHTISWTDSSPYEGGYAGFQNTYAKIDNFLLTPEPATMGVLLVGALGFLLRRRR